MVFYSLSLMHFNYLCENLLIKKCILFLGMDCFECDSSAPDSTSDLSSVLISMTDNLKAETLSNDIMW